MSSNGERPSGPLELSEVLSIHTKDGEDLPFEVVGILEDPEEKTSYAVLMHEPREEGEGEFIVTDLDGNLVGTRRWHKKFSTSFSFSPKRPATTEARANSRSFSLRKRWSRPRFGCQCGLRGPAPHRPEGAHAGGGLVQIRRFGSVARRLGWILADG